MRRVKIGVLCLFNQPFIPFNHHLVCLNARLSQINSLTVGDRLVGLNI
jgi:hypothetical protein